jgi:O-antigen/teichoic acid export membrane protein
MNIARSSLRVFFAKAISSVITFVGIAFFAQELGARQIGIFFLFQATLGMVAIPADLGISSGVTKRISEGESPDSIVSTSILIKLLLISPFILGIVLLRNPINNYIGGEVAVYLAIGLVLQEFGKLTLKILEGELRVGETAEPTLARKIAFVGVGSILIMLGFEARGIIFGLLAGLFIMFLWGAYKISLGFGTPSLTNARSLFDYSKYAFISSIGGYFYSWMDVAIIGFFLTQSNVGVYEIAWQVTAVTILFSSSIATTIFPQVSQWHDENAKERIEKVIPNVITPSMFFVIPAFVGIVLFSHEILGLVFGPEFTTGYLVLIILMGEKIFQSIHFILGRSLQGIDRPDLAAKATVIAIALNFFLNIAFVFYYGILGAAIATTLSFLVNTTLHARYLSRFITINIPLNEIRDLVLASIGMGISLQLIRTVYQIGNLPRLIVIILLGAIFYIVFVFIIPSSRRMITANLKQLTR